ncbi:Rid family hydrolase, partial [Rhodoplanes roseus]
MRKNISSASPFEPIIGFSRAVRIGNRVLIGGTAPIGEDGKAFAVGDAAAQTRRSIEIARIALEEAG